MTDPHERIVPPIMQWILTGCDINKDVTVSDKLQLTAINIQLKDADRVFRLYIKSLGDKAVYRVEESLKMRCSLVDVLRTIRSLSEIHLLLKTASSNAISVVITNIKHSHQLMEFFSTELPHLEVMLCHMPVNIGSTLIIEVGIDMPD